jgi:hypothetical protein
VSSKLLGQFADNLKRDVLEAPAAEAPTTAAPTTAATGTEGAPGIRKLDHPEPEPIDLAEHAGPLGKRLAPVIAAVIALVTLRMVVKRCKRCKRRKAAKRARA